jgi:hypothetical protein
MLHWLAFAIGTLRVFPSIPGLSSCDEGSLSIHFFRSFAMKTLRRNGVTIGIVFSLALLGSLWWRANTTRAVAIQEEPAPALTQVQRDAILKILNDVALDFDALVALNVDAEQAESVLSTTVTWQANNAGTMAGKQADIDAALTEVRTLEKAIAMGPPQEGQEADLATAVAELMTARAAYTTALSSLKSSVNQILSESQRTTWTAIQTGHDSTMPMRMLALSDESKLGHDKIKGQTSSRQ